MLGEFRQDQRTREEFLSLLKWSRVFSGKAYSSSTTTNGKNTKEEKRHRDKIEEQEDEEKEQ